MPPIELPFATQAGESSVTQNSRETLMNMYSEMEVSGRKRLIRRQRAGLRQLVANTGTKRAHEHSDGDGYDYLIIGSGLYRFDGTTLSSSLGTLSSTTGRCWIIFNDNNDLMISDGSTGYVYNGTSLATITTPDSVPVGPLAYQGGWGLFSVPGTGQWYITGLNDFDSVDALDFATAEAHPDPLVRIFIDHNQAFLYGTRTIEVWQLTGAAFPFQALTNSQIARGLAAPNAIVAEDNTTMFIGDDRVVYRLEGYRPVRVSTGPIERAILDVSQASMDSCDAFSYTSGGQKFLVFTFPDELTIQYNLATGLWNYCSTYSYDDWRIIGSSGGYSRYYSTPTGIVALDESKNTDEGGIMLRLARGAPGDAGGKDISVTKFRLDAEMGRAPIGGTAQVMLRFAPDGETYGNIKVRTLGERGQFKHKAVWRNLGHGEKPTIEVSASDDFRFAILSALAEIEVDTD